MNTDRVDWMAVVRERARLLENQFAKIDREARKADLPESAKEKLLAPYRRMLEETHVSDLQLARLADESDLLVHVKGPKAEAPKPEVYMVSKLLGQFRDSLGSLAKLISKTDSFRMPDALELRFSGIARGSIFLGFALNTAEPDDEEEREYAKALGEAVRSVALAASVIPQEKARIRLREEFPDPAIRDSVAGVVHRLAPGGRIGIRELDLFTRGSTTSVPLTPDVKRKARAVLAEPADTLPLPDWVDLRGTVRELDLDNQRFELRNVVGYPDVRCAYEFDTEEAKRLIDRRVRVTGTPEYSSGGERVVRLLWVNEYEFLD
jgi:hypothetical protein